MIDIGKILLVSFCKMFENVQFFAFVFKVSEEAN